MGSNRATPASASVSTTILQTHTPSGSSTPPIPVLDMSCSIKTEPSPHIDVSTDVRCHSENWAESYQDLSSWCSATSANSPAICQLPVTDETLVSEIDFQGEIDFDLRKSEEIASIPLEEDCSFNLWGSGNPLVGVNTPAPHLVPAATSVPSDPVLLKDCWWPKIDHDKVGKELESNRSSFTTSTSNLLFRNHLAPTTVKRNGTDTKENMNPVATPHPLLSDPLKMAELQMRLERIASHTHPGVNTKTKAADLMKILQGQIAMLNKKKHRSPAAVSDLHNYHMKVQGYDDPSTSTVETQPQFAQAAVSSPNVMHGVTTDIFYSDPFDGLFPSSDNQMDQVQQNISSQKVTGTAETNQSFHHNVMVSPAFVSNTPRSNAPDPFHQGVTGDLHGTDLFLEAHSEILKDSMKTQPIVTQPQLHPPLQGKTTDLPQRSSSIKNENGLTIQLPIPRINMPELDLNFDALLFGSPGSIIGSNRTPAISTPEVLKPLVETPDPESFDLLSYLCDDKASTPPVYLDNNNPFHFTLPSSSQSTTTLTNVMEHKPNVMIVKPLISEESKEEEKRTGSTKDEKRDSAVIIEVKPQLMPASTNLLDTPNTTLSDVEEEEDEDLDSKVDLRQNAPVPVMEEQVSPRPLRSPRKRKYSEDFVFSPSPSEESPKSSRRKRTTSSKYDSDEDFTLPVRKSRKRSAASVVEEDDSVKKKRSRGPPAVKRGERTVSTSSESDRYRELRDRNNEASRKSRLTRKAREQELGKQAESLTKENRVLKVKVEEMENLVKKLREALLHSMMKKT